MNNMSERQQLQTWMILNNQPAAFMHPDWWKESGCTALLPIYSKGRVFHGMINDQIMQILQLQPLPFDEKDSGFEQTLSFWVERFFLLKPMALLLGLFLTRNPEKVLLKAIVHRKISGYIFLEKLQSVLVGYDLVAGDVRKFLVCDDPAFDLLGCQLITDLVPRVLAERTRLLFSPHELSEYRHYKYLNDDERIRALQLIKRLFRLSELNKIFRGDN